MKENSMGTDHRTVLVTGATGKQGGAVVRHMLGRGWKLRALTRDPGSRAAQVLAASGVEILRGDLEDPGSFEPALRGVYGVYSVQDFWSVGVKREVVQGKNLANAAKQAGVEHFVYSSVGGAERSTGIDHWESKWEIERHIRNLGFPATILRPAAFMEGYYSETVELGILQGTLWYPIRGDKPYQTIATDDIGAFVALAFERPKDFIGLELEIAGSELTNLQAAEVFSRVLGRPVEFQELPIPEDKEWNQMFRWFNDAGFQANVGELRKRYPQVQLQTLEQWLYNEGWHKRVRRITAPRT
ncbi:MAG TPA: NmrA/HSCARG family protein [Bryobacteraceae bacterium]|nr:NmrA/HSCARG family protein [Bryobacteraceae bacterium]